MSKIKELKSSDLFVGMKLYIDEVVREEFCPPYDSLEIVTVSKIGEFDTFYIREDGSESEYELYEVDIDKTVKEFGEDQFKHRVSVIKDINEHHKSLDEESMLDFTRQELIEYIMQLSPILKNQMKS